MPEPRRFRPPWSIEANGRSGMPFGALLALDLAVNFFFWVCSALYRPRGRG
jgi:hypothetical protein